MCIRDRCTPYPSSKHETLLAAERSYNWAKECQKFHKLKDQSLFGIVQGGLFQDIRKDNALKLVDLEFPGYAIGGLSAVSYTHLNRGLIMKKY